MPIIKPYMFSSTHLSRLTSKIGCDVEKVITDNIIRCFIFLINEDDQFHNKWILKGRSGLSTSYMEQNFRLSDDIDYTIREYKEILNLDHILQKIEIICFIISNRTCQAIKFEKPQLHWEKGREKRKARCFELKIPYTLADIPEKMFKIKIEGSSLEKVLDPMPDGPFYGLELVIPGQNFSPRIKTYSHQEFFAEKLRGLVERVSNYNRDKEKNKYQINKIAKDIYDLVQLRKSQGGHFDIKNLNVLIKQKFEHKHLDFLKELQAINIPEEISVQIWESEVLSRVPYELSLLNKIPPQRKEEAIKAEIDKYTLKVNELIKGVIDVYNMEEVPYHNYYNSL